MDKICISLSAEELLHIEEILGHALNLLPKDNEVTDGVEEILDDIGDIITANKIKEE